MTHPAGGPTHAGPSSQPALVAGALALFIVGLLAGAGTAWSTSSRTAADPVPAAPTVLPLSTSASEPLATPAPAPRTGFSPASPSSRRGPSLAEREAAARAQLEDLAAQGYEVAQPSGQWVAQLSSKYPGIRDELQTARVSGGHTFRAVDIVAEYQDTRVRAEQYGATTVLIRGSDIAKGRQETSGRLFWYVFALEFGSKSEAESWCEELYPGLSGSRLDNRCYPTQLKP